MFPVAFTEPSIVQLGSSTTEWVSSFREQWRKALRQMELSVVVIGVRAAVHHPLHL
ncbi:hypothetical protein BH23GEM4_BH23GEM4_08010 [soil metagenome]